MKKNIWGLNRLEIPQIEICNCCLKEEWFDDYEIHSRISKIMADEHVCYQCAFWKDIIYHPEPCAEIINGAYWVIHPKVMRPFNLLKGRGGKEMYIRKFDGTLYKSNNVWCRGKIPKRFLSQLPDTANFITLQMFMKLKADNHTCYARLCELRHDCFRYNPDAENHQDPNAIISGNPIEYEGCRSFIHKNNILCKIQF